MEESLEQERLRLEEVVKMEIKARIQTTEALRTEAASNVAAMRGEMRETSAVLRKDLDQVRGR